MGAKVVRVGEDIVKGGINIGASIVLVGMVGVENIAFEVGSVKIGIVRNIVIMGVRMGCKNKIAIEEGSRDEVEV